MNVTQQYPNTDMKCKRTKPDDESG